jgi:hypothetical protein
MMTMCGAGSARAALIATATLLLFAGTSRAGDIDLTGKWRNDDASYAVRQVGDQVWWVCRSKDGGKTFTAVFHGKLTGKQLVGHFADVPAGNNRFQGSITGRLIIRDGAVVEIRGEALFSPSNERSAWFIRRD